MDHKTFLAELGPETRTALTLKSDRAGLIRLACHLGLIVLLASCIALRIPGWTIFVPLLGVVMAFLFTLQHECTHQTPFRTGWINEAAGHAAGAILVQPFLWFRYFHFAHHRYTNEPGRDPELDAPAPTTWRAWVWHLSCLGYWASKLRVLVGNARGQLDAPYLPQRTNRKLRTEALSMLAAYLMGAIVLFIYPQLFWLWPGPLLFGFPVLRLYLLAEHGRCPFVTNMFENTRTTLTNGSVRFLAWNMPFHAEHHAWPAVPFHHLPKLHALTAPHLIQTEQGYRRFTLGYLKGFGFGLRQ